MTGAFHATTEKIHKEHCSENDDVGSDQERIFQNNAQSSNHDENIQQSDHLINATEQEDISQSSSVQVAVRIRPFLPSEADASSCIDYPAEGNVVRIGKNEGTCFTFDHVLTDSTSQKDLYTTCVVPLVHACLKGYNATVLAYGQTGSGKTHTIVGPSIQHEIYAQSSENSSFTTSESSGMIPRAFQDLFHQLSSKQKEICSNQTASENSTQTQQQPYEYEVRIQFLELYGEDIRDLLSPSSSNNRLTIRDGAAGVEPEVIGASENTVQSAKEALLYLQQGTLRRVTAATQMNSESSRSHAILSVTVEQRTLRNNSNTINGDENVSDEEIEEEVKRSKFHFVDLAGSERQKRTKAEGQRLKEGIDINKGLLVLGNVISALGDSKKIGRTHVPYRESKLTRLLKGSLGGNHKTLMIACVSPASINMEESLNCLRYANRAKNIKNNAVINLDAGSRLVADLRGKCQDLARELLRVRDLYKNDAMESKGVNLEQGSSFTDRILLDLAAGKDTKFPIDSPKSTLSYDRGEARQSESGHLLKNKVSLKTLDRGSTNESNDVDIDRYHLRLAETKAELERMRQSSKQSKQELMFLKEQVYAVRAEKEYYRLQLSNESENHEDASLSQTNSKNNDTSDPIDMCELEEKDNIKKEFFVKKIAAYEKELASLRNELNEKKVNDNLTHGFDSNMDGCSKDSGRNKSINLCSHKGPLSDEIFDEEGAVERDVNTLTKKYLSPDEFDSPFVLSTQSPNGNSYESISKSELAKELEEKDKKYLHRKQNLEKNISLLTKNIVDKEELVEQLNASQGKYEVMRSFYEDKLHQMEIQVKTREQEREKMKRELKKIEKDKNSTAKSISQLKMSLETKEKRICFLRKQQAEISNLTKVSSRNLSAIQRLQNDIADMKKQKMLLQKQVTIERKSHVQEVQKLKKEATFRDKEVSRWKRESHKNSSIASNAKRVAKSRLEEITKLRIKYKDAEKKLRKQTVKKGALERAGVDPALLGRSDTSRINMSGNKKKQMNIDHLRKFLWEKITNVGKMEMIAEKIANEWEEHLELMNRKEDVLDKSFQTGEESLDDELEALAVQIKYKENRIRNLTRKLGSKPFVKHKSGKKEGIRVSFLQDKKFQSLSSGISSFTAMQATCKVLFGMVVRERRRVANLARTACNLDVKAIEHERLLQSKEDAFRSHVEEEKSERAKMARQHQEDIWSLMSLVKENDQNAEHTRTEEILTRGGFHALESEVRALRNDRNEKIFYKEEAENAKRALEKKMVECKQYEKQIQLYSSVIESLKLQDKDPNGNQSSFDNPNKQSLSTTKESFSEMNTKMTNYLNHVHLTSTKMNEKKDSRSLILDIVESDEEQIEDPEWADDIMADLALIAEGEIPPSLRNIDRSPGKSSSGSASRSGSGSESKKPPAIRRSISSPLSMESVFVRLADPHNFTGVQKQRQNSSPSSPGALSREQQNPRTRKKKTKSLDHGHKPKFVASKAKSKPRRKSRGSLSSSDGSGSPSCISPQSSPSSKSIKSNVSHSVYERLQDPSNFTGIQKARFDSTKRRPQHVKSTK